MGKEDIRKLFLYEHEWEIKRGEEVVGKVYQRILTDADVERARREALRESAILRKSLKNKDSDDYSIFVAPIFEAEREEIIAGIVVAETREIRERAHQKAKQEISFPLKPETSDLEEQEKYQEKLDFYNTDITGRTLELLAELMVERTKELEKEKDDEKLRKIYISSVRSNLCSARMLEIYQLWAAYLGTYENKKCTKRLFNSFKDFRNTATELQQQLVDGYFFLEIDKITLKKS